MGGFRLEHEMVRSASSSVRSAFLPAIGVQPCDWCLCLAEVPVGQVVPDLLIAASPFHPVRPRKRVSYLEGSVLAHLIESGPSSVQDIGGDLYVSDSVAHRVLSDMVSTGLARREGPDNYVPVKSFDEIHLVALEFKLRKWREALSQAATYLAFANRAYVVLDATQVRTTDALVDEYRRNNVGLVLQQDEDLNILWHPLPANPISAARLQALQRVWSASDSCVRKPFLEGLQPHCLVDDI